MIPLSTKSPSLTLFFNLKITSLPINLKNPDFYDVLLRKMLISHHLTKNSQKKRKRETIKSCEGHVKRIRCGLPFNGHRTTAIFGAKKSKLKIARKGEFKVDNGNFFAVAACEKRHENVSLQKKLL